MQQDQALFPGVVPLARQKPLQRHLPDALATPHWILQLFDGVWLFGYLHAAMELHIFPLIAAGVGRVADVATLSAGSERGTRILLDALTALRLLQKDPAGSYHLEPHTVAYLAKGSPLYSGACWQVADAVTWPCWSRLADAVRSGQPVFNPNEKRSVPEFWAPLAIALNALLRPAAAALIPLLGLQEALRTRRLLDIGSGSGSIGLLLATIDPGLRVTLLDRPHALRVAHDRARRLGLGGRFISIPGQPLQVEWGEGYDLVLLSNVLQQRAPAANGELLARAFRALRPGGMLVINELVADAERRLATYPLLFAGALLLGSVGGDTYTFYEINDWLQTAHFATPQAIPVAGRINTLIVARKPG
jgi:ubiquinone/menaquinone biosynthesis C-methylase UbiE